MRFESTGEELPMHELGPAAWDTIEDNLYLRVSNAGSPEEADAAIRDLQALRRALGRLCGGAE